MVMLRVLTGGLLEVVANLPQFGRMNGAEFSAYVGTMCVLCGVTYVVAFSRVVWLDWKGWKRE